VSRNLGVDLNPLPPFSCVLQQFRFASRFRIYGDCDKFVHVFKRWIFKLDIWITIEFINSYWINFIKFKKSHIKTFLPNNISINIQTQSSKGAHKWYQCHIGHSSSSMQPHLHFQSAFWQWKIIFYIYPFD
jgi:hypothetical protein